MALSLRKHFTDSIHRQMKLNKDIWVLLGDVGYGYWDQVREEFPDRCLNCGASEQAMTGAAVGLALAGKIPFVYTITPFLLYRPFETLRNYLHHEKVNVKLVGAGRNTDYGNNGFSHHATEDKELLKVLSNIKAYWPDTLEEIDSVLDQALSDTSPYYINLSRT